MKAMTTLMFAVLATLLLTACMDAPGGDGRYATHDRGNGTIDKALRR